MKFCGEHPDTDKQRRQAFELLAREHLGSLCRTAYRFTGSRETAEELAQEACLKAYVAFDQYEHGTNFRAWIFRILTNLCRDHLRKDAKGLFKAWDDDEVDANVACTNAEPQPHAELQQSEVYTYAIEAMAKLTPEIRLIVCLAVLDEMSYQEIAAAADIPLGTVRSRLSKGRKQLRSLLKVHALDNQTKSKTNNVASDIPTEKTEESRGGEFMLIYSENVEPLK